jgi:hypothetical protein
VFITASLLLGACSGPFHLEIVISGLFFGSKAGDFARNQVYDTPASQDVENQRFPDAHGRQCVGVAMLKIA